MFPARLKVVLALLLLGGTVSGKEVPLYIAGNLEPKKLSARRLHDIRSGMTLGLIVAELGSGWMPPTESAGIITWVFDDDSRLRVWPDLFSPDEKVFFRDVHAPGSMWREPLSETGPHMDRSEAFDLQPTLTGGLMTVRPLKAEDFEALYAAASDPLIWEQHPEPTRYQRDVFQKGFFAGALASGSSFVIIDNASGKVIGSSRYYAWDPVGKEVAVGYTFLTREHWGGTMNRELKRLMLDHAFRWAKVIWFHVGSGNRRSRKAVEKIGARFSHEEIKVVNGVKHPHAIYSLTHEELTAARRMR
jgi:N-acetyltransferase